MGFRWQWLSFFSGAILLHFIFFVGTRLHGCWRHVTPVVSSYHVASYISRPWRRPAFPFYQSTARYDFLTCLYRPLVIVFTAVKGMLNKKPRTKYSRLSEIVCALVVVNPAPVHPLHTLLPRISLVTRTQRGLLLV